MDPSSPGTAGIRTSTAAIRVNEGLSCPVEFPGPDPGRSAEDDGPSACPVADPGALIGAPGPAEASGTEELREVWGCPELSEGSVPFILFDLSGSVGFIRLCTPFFLRADCAFFCRAGFFHIRPVWNKQPQLQVNTLKEPASPVHWPHARYHQTPEAGQQQTPGQGLPS